MYVIHLCLLFVWNLNAFVPLTWCLHSHCLSNFFALFTVVYCSNCIEFSCYSHQLNVIESINVMPCYIWQPSSIAVVSAHPIYYDMNLKRSHNMRMANAIKPLYDLSPCTFQTFGSIQCSASLYPRLILFVYLFVQMCFFISFWTAFFLAFNVCDLLTRMSFRLQCPIYIWVVFPVYPLL